MAKKTEKQTQTNPASYPQRIMAVKTKSESVRYFVHIPTPLAAALGVEGGEEVSWELLDRDELHLVRHQAKPAKAKRTAKPSAT